MWNFNSDKPIYCQLIEQFRLKILSGEYPPGSKVASVRELAHEACVNPNTVQRAFTELEREGLVYTQRTSGRYITADQELISQCRSRTAAGFVSDFLQSMEKIGIPKEQLPDELKKYVKE
ncbi:MAG: GntR family transcriptional regulator [Firmicutes bacterium]|nr:GntR family transcriptional regulator [Bacillota bacterium]